MQLTYNLWHAQKKLRPKIEPLKSRVISGAVLPAAAIGESDEFDHIHVLQAAR